MPVASVTQWRAENPDEDPATSPFAIWGAGGAGNIVLTALNGAASSNVAGSAGGLVQASAVNVLQSLATSEVKDIADDLNSEEARFALQGIVGCAGAAAGGAGDCGSAAMGAATSVVLNNLLDGLGAPRDEDLNHDGAIDTADERLSLADQQARTNLVATLATAIAEGAGLEATSANYAARIETQNNAERTAKGNHVERVTRAIPEGYGLDELYGKSAEFQTLLDEVAEGTGLTADQLIENYNAWSACIGAEPEVCSVEHNEFYDAFGQLYGAYTEVDRQI